MQKILPWQRKEWQYLLARKNIGKLPHAILINGIDGVGKRFLAQNFAALLLCQNVLDDKVCGGCSACELLQVGNHPDLIVVSPEGEGKTIKVDRVREVIAELNNTTHFGGYRVVIIESAELLNVAASNALLKTLEEPAEGTIIILVTAHPAMLLATIRSRCQALLINTPSYFVAEQWLKEESPDIDAKLLLALAENSPFRALELMNSEGLVKRQEFFRDLYDLGDGKISSMQMVKRNLSLGLENLLEMFSYLISDLIKIKFGVDRDYVNQDQITRLTSLAAKTRLELLFIYQENIYNLRRHLARKINLNQQIAMENLVISWLGLFKC